MERAHRTASGGRGVPRAAQAKRRQRPGAAALTALAVALLPAAAAGAPFAYVTNGSAGTVSVLDTATNTVVATVAVGNDPRGVAVHPAGTRVYVSNWLAGTVSVLDTATNTVVATVPVGDGPLAFGHFVGPAAAAPSVRPVPTVSAGAVLVCAVLLPAVAAWQLRREARRRTA